MDYTADLIAALEDEVARQKRRIAELTEERDEQAILIAEQDEQHEKVMELLDRWQEVFDLTNAEHYETLRSQYNALRTKHNRLVRDWNAHAAPTLRNFGRPLAASPAQQANVLKRRKAGESLRFISEATGLGFQTVRTILDKRDGVDRATMARLAEVAPEKMKEARDQAMRKVRKALPAQVKILVEKGVELHKAAKGLSATKVRV